MPTWQAWSAPMPVREISKTGNKKAAAKGEAMSGARRVYEALVRSPVSNAVVGGLLGAWAFYSGVSDYWKQSKLWPGGVTLGVMGIIWAAQVLTGASRIEILCTWRIFFTFFGLYGIMNILAEGKGDSVLAVVKGVAVIGIVYTCLKVWRRSYSEP